MSVRAPTPLSPVMADAGLPSWPALCHGSVHDFGQVIARKLGGGRDMCCLSRAGLADGYIRPMNETSSVAAVPAMGCSKIIARPISNIAATGTGLVHRPNVSVRQARRASVTCLGHPRLARYHLAKVMDKPWHKAGHDGALRLP